MLFFVLDIFTMAYKPLTDNQWELIEPHIPKQKTGRPRTRNREILEAILYILSTGCRWEELPQCFPPKMTVFDRFKVWQKEGFFEELFRQFKQKKQEVQQKAKEIYYLDATIKSAKKGRLRWTSRKTQRYENKPHCQ
jgi:transposase